MEKKTSIWYNAMTYGLILGIALTVYSLLLYIIGADIYNPQSAARYLSWVSYLIIIGGIIYGTKNYRDKVLGGTITYSKSLGFGTLLGLFASFLVTLYTIIFLKFIDPNVIQYILDMTRQNLEAQGLQDTQIDKAIELTGKIMFPSMVIGSLIGTTFIAFVISLFTSIFLKKEGNAFDSAMKDVQ